MNQITFRFYGPLNDFLPAEEKGKDISYSFENKNSIKDMIESRGVPHPEVGLVLVDGEPQPFSYIPKDGDRICVYSFFCSANIPERFRGRSPLPSPLKFVLDIHLGKLAGSLRMLGLDCLYRNDYRDERLAEIAQQEGRIVLTRDVGVLKRNAVTYGYFVRQTNARLQLEEIWERFELALKIRPFARCIICNELLAPISKEEVLDRLPPKVMENYDRFTICRSCDKVYWPGSHFDRMKKIVDELMQPIGSERSG